MCLIYTKYHTFLVITHTYNNRIKIKKRRNTKPKQVNLMPPTSETIRKLELQKVFLDDLRYLGASKRGERLVSTNFGFIQLCDIMTLMKVFRRIL